MSKVQRTPRGLLALLGIVGEQPPDQLLAEYRAVVESLEMLLAELPVEQVAVNNAAATTNSTAQVPVPPGEVWFVTGVQATITAVAVGVSNTIGILTSFGRVVTYGAILGSTVPGVPVAARVDSVGWVPPRPLFANAGQNFDARLDATDAAGAQSLTCTVRFRRILV